MTTSHEVASREQWLEQRKQLLREEKEFTHHREALAQKRRELPWVRVEKNYVFAGPSGPQTLADLFAGRRQLLVYHFMFAPEWSQGCKSCSLLVDHFDPTLVHLAHRDTSMTCVSRAPIDKILAFRERMGWQMPWVSSGDNDFNSDYGVYFTVEELESGRSTYNYATGPYPITDLPGLSAFVRDDDGTIYHTYSTYARGLDIFLNVYNLLDASPLGRQEARGEGMNWVRHHDRYSEPVFIDPWNEPAAVKPNLKK
ncbi:MAG: DUF899 domain-containing protein [Pirellulales bacterium]